MMQIKCTQCGGDVEVKEGETFLTCEYCDSALFVDKQKVVFHYVVGSTLGEEEARRNVDRWMSGNDTPKDLVKKRTYSGSQFFYFPMWHFTVREGASDAVHLQPAASTTVSEIKSLDVPAGSLKFYSPKEFGAETFVPPEVEYDAAMTWLEGEGVDKEKVHQTALVHAPLYKFNYDYEGQGYTAVVDAASGKVMVNVFPPKSEAPFYILGVLALIVFAIEGFAIPLDKIGLKALVYLVTAVPLILLSYLIAKKV
jgi:DNA-directed RNA polymerase subunit RPC12/RpoP